MAKKASLYSAEQVPKFRSRYRHEDTSYLLPENQPSRSYYDYFCGDFWWSFGCCLLNCCSNCSRRKCVVSIFALLVVTMTLQNASTIWRFINDNSTNMSMLQSYGYLEEPNWKWIKRQDYHWEHTASTLPKSAVIPDSTPAKMAQWFSNHWHVNFECPSTKLLANYYTVCNPSRLKRRRNCLVYISGPTQLNEKAANDLLPHLHPSCQIHVFDPTMDLATTSRSSFAKEANTTHTKHNNNHDASEIRVHPWGFTGRDKSNTNSKASSLALKSLPDTLKALQHRRQRIDLFILNCAGCEWAVFPELIKVDISQLVLQVHDTKPQIQDLFEAFQQNNYVLYHKKPVKWKGLVGRAQLFSFLKLRKGFFRRDPKAVAK